MKRVSIFIMILCAALALTACSGRTKETVSADKVLVVYFSCTGNTQRVAENIADILGADIYEIVPEEPYTSADIDSGTSSGRAFQEQNDDARPAISGSVENMADYDVIFMGYPIWWGDAPKIMCTFLESYDFSGKTIIPFCTSGSSGIGSSAADIHGLASGSPHWLEGIRFPSGAARQTIVEWIDEIPIKFTAN